jgi:NAD(P)-dependent dehydrogenase (short-subunit alcohol dehydrogenase family)
VSEPRSCVVTGAAGGIGSEIAGVLLESGWSVVGLDLVDSEPMVTVAPGAHFASVAGDVADASSHRRAAAAAQELAPLVGWVNCAGYNILGTVAVDLLGVFLGTAEAVRHFLEIPRERRQATIVNISSIQASVGFPGFAAYAMCKGGIESLTKQVAAEYIAAAIRCNAVAPGLVESPMNADMLNGVNDKDEVLWRWGQLTPMGRWGQPRDIASAVNFLMSPESSYITGHVIAVNGGALTLAPGQGNR